MTFRGYILMMAFASVFAWAAWITSLVTTDPTTTDTLRISFFYISFACASIGTLSLAGTLIRIWRYPDIIISRHVVRAFRQAILLTSILIVSLLLLSHDLFRFWSAFLLVMTTCVVELIFLSSPKERLN